MQKFIDLSHPIDRGMPVYPGTPIVTIQDEGIIENDGFREKSLHFSSHTGTHIDAPAHILPEGLTTDQLNLSAFTGNGLVLNLNGSDAKQLAEIRSFEQDLKAIDFILFCTGHDKYWGNKAYFKNIPVPSPELVNYLCSFQLKGIGIDAISIDSVGSTTLENHHTILRKKMIIIENLTNLSQLEGKKFRFNCFPLPIKSGDGSPVRAMAEIE